MLTRIGALTVLTSAVALSLSACGGSDVTPDSARTYKVILGHDGHPDPDDNLASLAGTVAAERDQAAQPARVQLIGMVYGDTTEARQQGMLTGSGTGNASDDLVAQANYAFFRMYAEPALQSVGFTTFRDVTPQTYNFKAKALSDMTTGGQLIAQTVKAALDDTSLKYRVVYSAGGGENTAAEAIGYLRNIGYTDEQIRSRFAIVQHSAWNWINATETAAQTIAAPFTIRIEDQNKFTGPGLPPLTVSAARTSPAFVDAWNIAIGNTAGSGIPNFESKRDASDAGSDKFSTDPTALDRYWDTRDNSLTALANQATNMATVVRYEYSAAAMAADLN
jgi:hypothetical protein